MGETFPCGTMIELLDDHKLLLHHADAELIGQTVEFEGILYEPASLDPALNRALHLPSGTEDYVSLDSLAAELSDLFVGFAAMEEFCARWLALFSMQTWIRDALPDVAPLNLWGTPGSEQDVLQILELLCRHPLRLFESSVTEVAALADLGFTLLLNRPPERVLRPLVACNRGGLVLRGGRVLQPRTSTLVVSDNPRPDMLSLSLLATVPGRRLSPGSLSSRCLMLRAKLLDFRLRHYQAASVSQFDLPGLTPAMRMVARSYGATVAGCPSLLQQLTIALERAEDESRDASAQSLPAMMTEVLQACCHEDRAAVPLTELTELLSALSLSRGERIELTPKAVGTILRQQLGLSPRRKEYGYELPLGVATRTRVHRLARAQASLSRASGKPGCALCPGAQTLEPNEAGDVVRSDVPDVQDVHPISSCDRDGFTDDPESQSAADVQHVQQVQVASAKGPSHDDQ
jgi:hypothetical protein